MDGDGVRDRLPRRRARTCSTTGRWPISQRHHSFSYPRRALSLPPWLVLLTSIEVGVDQGRVLEAYTDELSLVLVLDNRILHEASEIQAEMALALFDAKVRFSLGSRSRQCL